MIATANPAMIRPGVHDGIPQSVYCSWRDEHNWPLANHSTLKLFDKPPAKAKHLMDLPPEPSDALNMGDGAHAATLEPTRFATEFIRGLERGRRSNEDKAAWADFEDEHHGKMILPPDDYDACCAMRDALWNQESTARSMLQAPGKNERSFVWRDHLTKLLCRGRADRMARWQSWTIVVDLKTARSAAMDDFSRDIAKYSYASQAAFYLDGLATLYPLERRWFWIVVEKDPPYLHAVYEPTDRLLEQGRRMYRRWIDIYKHCRETDIWPGYPPGIQEIEIPKWSRDDLFQLEAA
jgi:hypothetical protein